jgi:hypothetical protein
MSPANSASPILANYAVTRNDGPLRGRRTFRNAADADVRRASRVQFHDVPIRDHVFGSDVLAFEA